MITTTAGKFEADSPFLRRPAVRGVGGIGVTQSARTLVVQPMPGAKVSFNPRYPNRPTP
jgi:hypothetical protein